MRESTTVWMFDTREYRVTLDIESEEVDPVDHFDNDDDVAAIHRGEVQWFAATVRVFKNGYCIGSDHLGCCSYRSVEEFYTSHRAKNPMHRNCSLMRRVKGENTVLCHYFPSMVQEAIKDARRTMRG